MIFFKNLFPDIYTEQSESVINTEQSESVAYGGDEFFELNF